MTRLSPAGTGVPQCTSEAGPDAGEELAVVAAEADAVAGALDTVGEE
jgi:hypothetical protein